MQHSFVSMTYGHGIVQSMGTCLSCLIYFVAAGSLQSIILAKCEVHTLVAADRPHLGHRTAGFVVVGCRVGIACNAIVLLGSTMSLQRSLFHATSSLVRSVIIISPAHYELVLTALVS